MKEFEAITNKSKMVVINLVVKIKFISKKVSFKIQFCTLILEYLIRREHNHFLSHHCWCASGQFGLLEVFTLDWVNFQLQSQLQNLCLLFIYISKLKIMIDTRNALQQYQCQCKCQSEQVPCEQVTGYIFSKFCYTTYLLFAHKNTPPMVKNSKMC